MVSTRYFRGFSYLVSEDFESKLRVNQHTERVRKELREMTSEMNHFYQRYSGLDEENEFLRESLLSLLNRINDESVSKELSDLGQEIRSKLGEFE